MKIKIIILSMLILSSCSLSGPVVSFADEQPISHNERLKLDPKYKDALFVFVG